MTEREIRALQRVSFSIGSGERVGIIGRNGAGKTTLLSLLAGIAQPTSGEIEVLGNVHAMLTIGMVLRDEATGRENIFLDGAVHGHSPELIEELVPKIIDFVELGEFIDRPVRTYSSGMKARLAFTMGAFTVSDILIIDETLSVGDAAFSRKATRRMKELASEGQIVIAVSHSLSSIVEICDRCLWLDGGRLVMDGPAQEVTKAYAQAVDAADEAELKQKFESDGLRPASPGKRDDQERRDTSGGKIDRSVCVRPGADRNYGVRGTRVAPMGRATLSSVVSGSMVGRSGSIACRRMEASSSRVRHSR